MLFMEVEIWKNNQYFQTSFKSAFVVLPPSYSHYCSSSNVVIAWYSNRQIAIFCVAIGEKMTHFPFVFVFISAATRLHGGVAFLIRHLFSFPTLSLGVQIASTHHSQNQLMTHCPPHTQTFASTHPFKYSSTPSLDMNHTQAETVTHAEIPPTHTHTHT